MQSRALPPRPGAALALAAGLIAFSPPAHAQTPNGQALFAERCALCHGERADGGQGPALRGVVGRRAGAARFGYSQALRDAGVTWTADRLDRYLADPAAAIPGAAAPPSRPAPQNPAIGPVLTGAAAFGDWRSDAPGVRRLIRPGDLPPPYGSRSASNSPDLVRRPADAVPQAPPGFAVTLFAEGLQAPRLMRTAPNGDVFVAETASGRIRVLRASAGAPRAASDTVFVSGLRGPFGIAFYPSGPNPRYVYVGLNNQVVRFPYQPGDTVARGAPEVVVPELARTSGGHTTRDVAFAADGSRMFVSVGSGSNVAEGIGRAPPEGLDAWRAQAPLGAAWGSEAARADVLSYNPDGSDGRVFAAGIRNCVGLAVQPANGELWCSTNERDGLGDNVPPDYVTRVRAGAFYGWPWYYIGNNEDPRHRGARPDLAGRMTEPDVLLQPHSASLGTTFYTGQQFPRAYWGDAFAALHGSWNRGKRTGYKLVRIRLENGVPTGVYEDFLTGFVLNDDAVWGRPVGVTVAADGALLVSEDGNGTIWRVAFRPEDEDSPAASAVQSWIKQSVTIRRHSISHRNDTCAGKGTLWPGSSIKEAANYRSSPNIGRASPCQPLLPPPRQHWRALTPGSPHRSPARSRPPYRWPDPGRRCPICTPKTIGTASMPSCPATPG